MSKLVLISVVVMSLAALAMGAQSKNSAWSMLPSLMTEVYNECGRKDYDSINDCLKLKVVWLLDRAAQRDVIELDGSVKLVRQQSHRTDHARVLTDNEIQTPVVGEGKILPSKLNQMIFDRISNFFFTHTLKVALPKFDTATVARDLSEGRGKMKKTMGMFMMAIMMKAMMVIPTALGTLFILAGKALIISKIALVLSLMVLLKKLVAKPTEHVVHENHNWNPSGNNGGWDRTYRQPDLTHGQNGQAQNLAYNSYVNH